MSKLGPALSCVTRIGSRRGHGTGRGRWRGGDWRERGPEGIDEFLQDICGCGKPGIHSSEVIVSRSGLLSQYKPETQRYSDHISVMLIPAYRPLLKLAKPVQKLITIWPENATSTLQDCFQCTDWNMFKEAATYNNHTDLQEYTETVTAYIKKCMDDVTVTKTITTRANQKPWMTAEVRGLLKTRDEAFRSGDKAALKTARANLSRGIKNAKRSHAQKINNHFTDSRDTRSLWQAIQTITDYKPPPQACDDDPSLPDTLNHFYSRFEMQNDTPAQKLQPT